MTVIPILLTVSGSVRRGKEEEVKRMLEDTLHDEVMADFKPFFQKVLVREFKLREKPQLRRANVNSVSQWKESAGEFSYKVKYELQIVDGMIPSANAVKSEIEYRGIVLSNLDVWRDETLFPEPPVVTLRVPLQESKTGSPKARWQPQQPQNSTRRRQQQSRSRSRSPRSVTVEEPFSWIWKFFSGR